MRKRNIVFGAAALLLAIAWYAFRPELLFINKTVNEDFPGGAAMAAIEKGPMLVTTGKFKGLAHETQGLASIYQLPGGKRTLRLTEFETSNGPDVHVYLVAASDATDDETVKKAGFLDLGSIKGNIGDQNYDLPIDVDLNKYRAVTVWCKRFGVNFATAPLLPTQS
jgi:hypothetical protein